MMSSADNSLLSEELSLLGELCEGFYNTLQWLNLPLKHSCPLNDLWLQYYVIAVLRIFNRKMRVDLPCASLRRKTIMPMLFHGKYF